MLFFQFPDLRFLARGKVFRAFNNFRYSFLDSQNKQAALFSVFVSGVIRQKRLAFFYVRQRGAALLFYELFHYVDKGLFHVLFLYTPTAQAKAFAHFLAYSGHYLGSRTVAYPIKHG
jgi:hypothetical protein